MLSPTVLRKLNIHSARIARLTHNHTTLKIKHYSIEYKTPFTLLEVRLMLLLIWLIHLSP